MYEQIQIFKWLRQAAKKGAQIDMASSAVPSVTASELGLDGADFPIYDGANSPLHFPQLREMLAARYRIHVDMIALSSAASGANFLVPAAVLRPGDEALAEKPYYEPQWRSAQVSGAKINFFRRRPEDNFRLNPDEVRRAITSRTRLIIMSNPHNPSMQQADEADITAVADIAAENDAYLLIDEVYRELFFDSIQDTAVKLRDNIIVTSSFSKALGLQGPRIGWVLAPKETILEVWKVLEHISVIIPTPSAHLLARALEREATLQARAQVYIEGKADIIRRWAQKRGDIKYFEPSAGANVLTGLPEGIDSMRFCNRLVEERGVMVDPGDLFGIPGYIRMSLMESPGKIEQALEAIDTLLE